MVRRDPADGDRLDPKTLDVSEVSVGPAMQVDLKKPPVVNIDRNSGTVRISSSDGTLLEVGLPSLPAGRYRVFWSVVARDGHRTEGDFSFTVK